MFCPNCGNNCGSAKFCTECGIRLVWDNETVFNGYTYEDTSNEDEMLCLEEIKKLIQPVDNDCCDSLTDDNQILQESDSESKDIFLTDPELIILEMKQNGIAGDINEQQEAVPVSDEDFIKEVKTITRESKQKKLTLSAELEKRRTSTWSFRKEREIYDLPLHTLCPNCGSSRIRPRFPRDTFPMDVFMRHRNLAIAGIILYGFHCIGSRIVSYMQERTLGKKVWCMQCGLLWRVK